MTEPRAEGGDVRVRHNGDGQGLFYDVTVPVYRDGRTLTAEIPVRFDVERDVLTIEVSGELLDQSPEAVTAAVQLAFRGIANDRKANGEMWWVA